MAYKERKEYRSGKELTPQQIGQIKYYMSDRCPERNRPTRERLCKTFRISMNTLYKVKNGGFDKPWNNFKTYK